MVPLAWALVGCQPNLEPMERVANTIITQVVNPAVTKAGEELATESASLHGSGQLINPGYVMDGYGIVGTGFVWRATIRLEGASANLSAATQGGQIPAKEPDKEPE